MTRQPNILFITDDQHRWDYVGCAGRFPVRTPHLDRLAAEGAWHPHCYSVAPLCMPARCCLHTGLYAHQHGVDRNDRRRWPFDVPMLPQRLREAGCLTAAIPRGGLRRGRRAVRFRLPDGLRPALEVRPRDGQRTGTPLRPRRRSGRMPRPGRRAQLPRAARAPEGSSDRPTRRHTDMWEDGIRVPLAMRWPKVLPAGRTSDALVSSVDVTATAYQAAGGDPAAARMDGKDLSSGWGRGVRQELCWRFGESWAIRRGDMKLVQQRDYAPMLYVLKNDVGETRDLSGERPALVAELRAAWQAWDTDNIPALWKQSLGKRPVTPPAGVRP